MQHTSEFSSNVPGYLNKLPCAKHAWLDVTGVVDTARVSVYEMNNSHNFVELEIRFGKRAQGFQPGIPLAAFTALEQQFDSGRDWVRVVDWHNISVFMHNSSIPGDTRVLRTEVTYPPGCTESKRTECMHKELITNHDYRTVPLGMKENENATNDIRLALNVEHAVPESDIPTGVSPTAVHLKVRKCYYYAPTGCDTPVWCYVLTKRWVGATYYEALAQKQTEPPIYEMEIECLSSEYILSKESGRIAAVILYKACDVLNIIDATLSDRSSYIIEPINNHLLWTRPRLC